LPTYGGVQSRVRVHLSNVQLGIVSQQAGESVVL
jgi:hypothetical protein